jgi:hypothetical protein
MSNKLVEIFQHHANKNISFKVDGKSQEFNLMDNNRFVSIVTKLVKTESNGKKFETLNELHKYLGI